MLQKIKVIVSIDISPCPRFIYKCSLIHLHDIMIDLKSYIK